MSDNELPASGWLLCCVTERSASASVRLAAAARRVPYRELCVVALRLRGETAAANVWLESFKLVNRTLFERRAIVPFRFGTVAPRADDIARFLRAAYLQLQSLLAELRGRGEFVVVARSDLRELLDDLLCEDAGLREAVQSAGSADADRAGRLLFEAAQRKRFAIERRMHEKLGRFGVAAPDAPPSGEDVLTSQSYLIPRRRARALETAVGELGRDGPAYLGYHVAGPLPPYSFVPVAFGRANFEVVDSARRTLGLSARACLDEIRTAYRRLARATHPDRNPGDPAATARFRELAAACRTLKAYCAGARPIPNGGDTAVFSFAEGDVAAAFPVRPVALRSSQA